MPSKWSCKQQNSDLFQEQLGQTLKKIHQMSELTGSNHRCRAQLFKGAHTVVGQRFGGAGPDGLSYYYYNH